jgi:hypothetical protein
MGIYARAPQSKFKPAPEGLHQGVCCDIWEPWTETSPFHGGLVDKTRIVWQIAEQDEEHGQPFEVSQIYTLSLHEKAKLCGHLESWRGRKFTEAEKREFDLEVLLGVNCQLQVVHVIKDDGRVFANVQAIVPLGKGQTKLRVAGDFVRRKDRKDSASVSDGTGPVDQNDDDVPF